MGLKLFRHEEEDIPAEEGPSWSPPQTDTIQQWGLKLPDDTVAWGRWSNIPFDNPLDRMRMIATLQKTALNMGFAEGEQMTHFLQNYGWKLRDLRITTQFSPSTTTLLLDDPMAAEITTNESHEQGAVLKTNK